MGYFTVGTALLGVRECQVLFQLQSSSGLGISKLTAQNLFSKITSNYYTLRGRSKIYKALLICIKHAKNIPKSIICVINVRSLNRVKNGFLYFFLKMYTFQKNSQG